MKKITLVLLGLLILSLVISSFSLISEFLIVLTLASFSIYLISGGPGDFIHEDMEKGELFSCIFLTVIFVVICFAVLNSLIPKEWFTDVDEDRIAYANERLINSFVSIIVSLALGVLTFRKGFIERYKRVNVN